MALKVGAAIVTKRCVIVGLANTQSCALGNPETQTLEYKGFDLKKARKLGAVPIGDGTRFVSPPQVAPFLLFSELAQSEAKGHSLKGGGTIKL